MVISRLLAAAAAFAVGSLLAQSVPPVVDTTRQALPQVGLAPATPEPSPDLTPELRGDILMARKNYREAIEVYKQAGTGSAIILNKIGIAYHQMLQLDTARKHYERSIKVNPNYAEAVNNLGTIYYAQKNYRRATNLYNQSLKLAPNSASVYSNLGTALFARKRYKEAFDAYQKALSLDPEVFERRSTYGVLLQERSVDDRAKFHYYLARTYAKAGMNDRALLYLRKAIEEGLKERHKMAEEPEFTTLKELPEFQELLKLEPRVL